MLAGGLVVGCVVAQAATDQFRVRRMPGWDERAPEGRCEIRVLVDDEANIFVEGDLVTVETVRGRPGRDAGSECSQPLPRGQGLVDFEFRGIDGRGRVELIQRPERRNGFRAWVRIEDRQGGAEEYHFRLRWRQNWSEIGGRRPDRGPGWGGFDSRPPRDGVCFFSDRGFRGEAFCVRAGEDVRNVGPKWNDRFRSVRFFGRARGVEIYRDEDFHGPRERLDRDEPDLGRFNRAITSFRVR
jgi:hypothetical protein